MGTLCAGINLIGIFVGIAVVLVGIAHIVLACYFRNTLDPSSDFDKHGKDVENSQGGPAPSQNDKQRKWR